MKYCCKFLCVAAITAAAAGCVDDNYDLADIDTTVGVTVDQLVIPINIDEITLGDIFDIDEDDRVTVIDGHYAIVQDGVFESSVMNIPSIDLNAPVIEPSETTVSLIDGLISSRSTATFVYDLANDASDFRFDADFVSDFIIGIDHLGCQLTLTVDITMRGLESIVRRISFSEVVLQLPKGLDLTADEGGSYDRVTGLLTLPDRVITGNSLTLQFAASGVDFNLAGGVYDYDNSSVSVLGSLFIRQGKAIIDASDIVTSAVSLPQSVTLYTEYALSDTRVTTFSGRVKYEIADADLTEVDLSDLPDVLSQNATDLTFVNPMVYLHITNPLQGYSLYARTGLDVTAYHDADANVYTLDYPWFQIGPSADDGEYDFCLSPQMPSSVDPDFVSAVHVPFSQLSNVLSGSGIPKRLSIDLQNPNIPAQTVSNFRLGEDLGALHGRYRFVAPLQFGEGSAIVYADVIDGWMSDDLERLVIRSLEVNLTVSTDIPVAIDFTGYPVDVNGNRIGSVDIVGANIEANASDQRVTIRIAGEIRGLDGICFEARAKAVDGDVLRPDMTIRLSDIRPCVSGYYEKEL